MQISKTTFFHTKNSENKYSRFLRPIENNMLQKCFNFAQFSYRVCYSSWKIYVCFARILLLLFSTFNCFPFQTFSCVSYYSVCLCIFLPQWNFKKTSLAQKQQFLCVHKKGCKRNKFESQSLSGLKQPANKELPLEMVNVYIEIQRLAIMVNFLVILGFQSVQSDLGGFDDVTGVEFLAVC